MSHVLPNCVGPVIVQATLTLATAVIEAAALSFLGLGGGEPSTAEWGRMLTAAQQELAVAPRLAILPGICIAVTALGFTLVGESLREALDPGTGPENERTPERRPTAKPRHRAPSRPARRGPVRRLPRPRTAPRAPWRTRT